ncbi:16398_t:CDS:2, partial [Gigaspora margarita]
MTTSFHIDNNGNIRLPFGWSVEHYLYSLTISQNIQYKVQSRKRVNDVVKQELITVECVEGSVDYLGWKTNKGHSKSTNQLDDILRLTENGRLRVQQIRARIKSDIHVWRWVWFCSGDGGYQRSCGGFGDCIKECNHYSDQHNFNNPFDMHKYSVQILTKVMLSEIDTEFPNELEYFYNSQNSICDDVKLRQLIERDSLHNIIEEISPQFVFEAGQVTYWNSRIIEHQSLPFKQLIDMKQRLNQGRLYALLHSVRPVEGGSDIYFYVKKENSGFRSPYTMRKINIDNKSFELLQQMIDKLASKHPVMQQNDYYLHVHAARLFDDIENNKIMLNSIKHDLVQYFCNKERAMPKEQKNLIIYSDSHGVTEKDPFRPMEMPARRISDVGTSKMHGAKLRKSNGFISDKE